MFFDRLLMLVLPVAFFLASSLSNGEEFNVGESVIVATESVDVMAKQQKLGSVPRGTGFKIRQKNPSWLLGEFRIGNRTVLGWVRRKAVSHANPNSTETMAHDFTWENLLYAKVKLDKDFDFDTYVDDYLIAFRLAVWKRYRNDEFQLAKKRAEALRIFRERVDDFDLNQDFVIRANLTIGKYDFKRSAFPIEEATERHYWHEHRYTGSEFPDDINVFFKNPELIGYVRVPPDAAERFLSTRKNRRGDVNRQVFANIRIRVCSMKNERNELWSEIRWAQFFSDNKRTALLYETPKPPPVTHAVPGAPKSDVGTSGDDTKD